MESVSLSAESDNAPNILDEEIDAFMDALPEMLDEHEGQYVVFKDDKSIGFWACEEDAINAGYEQVGYQPFLVRQISRDYEIWGRYGKPITMY